MKLLTIGIVALSLALLGNLQAEVPAELQSIIKNPPSLKRGKSGTHFPATGGLLIESPDFISFVSITKQDNSTERDYTFKTYSKKFKQEVAGEGLVFEHYYRVSDPNSEKRTSSVIDKGSVLFIDAGLFKAEWSLGDYLYLPDTIKVKEASLEDYTALITKKN